MVCKTGGAAALRLLAVAVEAFCGPPIFRPFRGSFLAVSTPRPLFVFRPFRGPFSAVSTPRPLFGCIDLHLLAPEIEAGFDFEVETSCGCRWLSNVLVFQLNVAVPVPENAAAKDFLGFRAASETFYLITSSFSSQLRPKKPSFVFFNLLLLPSHSWLLDRLCCLLCWTRKRCKIC